MHALLFFSFFVTYASAASYDLAVLPIEQKQSICVKSLAFCENTCNGSVMRNTCDSATMKFDCACAAGPLPVSLHYFPIQAQQCIGESQDCRNACSANDPSGASVGVCSNACDLTFVCGTATAKEQKNFSPDSNLIVIAPNATSTSASPSVPSIAPFVSPSTLPHFNNTVNTTNSAAALNLVPSMLMGGMVMGSVFMFFS